MSCKGSTILSVSGVCSVGICSGADAEEYSGVLVPTSSEAPTSSYWWSTKSSLFSSIFSGSGTSNLLTF